MKIVKVMRLPLLLIFSMLAMVFAHPVLSQEQKTKEDSVRSEDIPMRVKPSTYEDGREAIPDTTETDNLTVVEQQDTVESVPVTPPEPASFFNSIGIGVDYGKLMAPLFDLGKRYEVMLDLEFKKKISLMVEAGMYELDPANAIINGSYHLEGTYFRGGIAYFIAHQDNNRVYTGAMAGQASFEDRGEFTINSRLWQDFEGSFERPVIEALWFEWILGTEGELFAGFTWGWMFRLRFLQELQVGGTPIEDIDQTFEINNIPGYGKPASDLVPAVNFIIKYNLNF